MSVAITDPAQIAASLDGSTGDNSNLTAMLNVQNQTIVNGQTPLDRLFQPGLSDRQRAFPRRSPSRSGSQAVASRSKIRSAASPGSPSMKRPPI